LNSAGSGEGLTDGSIAVVRYRGSVIHAQLIQLLLYLLSRASFLSSADVLLVLYYCKAGGKVFTLSESQSVTIGDGTMIPGWDEALKTMAVGEQVCRILRHLLLPFEMN